MPARSCAIPILRKVRHSEPKGGTIKKPPSVIASRAPPGETASRISSGQAAEVAQLAIRGVVPEEVVDAEGDDGQQEHAPGPADLHLDAVECRRSGHRRGSLRLEARARRVIVT